MDIDDTQVLTLSEASYNSDEDNNSSKEKKVVAHLKVRRQKELPETLYPIYEGETLIGRDPERCNIHIPVKALSKIHACIVVTGKHHMIYDKNSRNKTRKGKVFLEPDVRYNLEDGDCVTFADVKCSYMYMKTQCDDDDDATDSNLGDSSLKLPNNNDKPTQHESVHYELDEDELSSDILQPTQADALPSVLYHQSQATQLYVAESDEDKGASSTEATDYIPDSDGETEVKKDSSHMIQDPTIQYDLLTEEKRDNDNVEVSTKAVARESSGEDNQTKSQSGTSTAGFKDPVTIMDTEAYDIDLDATQSAGIDPEVNQSPQMDVVAESQSQMATQTFGQDNDQNKFVDKKEAATACAKDPVSAMDTEAYNLNDKQSASLDPEVNHPAQVDVVPDSQSQMATQTFGTDEEKEDDLSTQTFKDHSLEEHRHVLNTECSTLAFSFNSSDDDIDDVSDIFQSCHSANNADTTGTTTRNDSEAKSASEVISPTKHTKALADSETIQMCEQIDDTQIFTEVGNLNSSEKSGSTQVLEDDNNQLSEKPDATQIIAQPDEAQMPVEVDATKNPETSDKTQTVKDDSLIKHSDTTDSALLLTEGCDNTAQDKSSGTQTLAEFNGNKISEKSISLHIPNKDEPIKLSGNSAATQMLTADDRCDKSDATLLLADDEASRLVQEQDNLDDQDTSELYIAETQLSEHSDTGINVSQGFVCDNNESLVIAETPVGVVRHVARTEMDAERSAQSLPVVTEKEVKAEDKTRENSITENTAHNPDDAQLTEADKVDVPIQDVISHLQECDTLSAGATLSLDNTRNDTSHHHVLKSSGERPEPSSSDNTNSSNVMERKSLSPSALITTSTSTESLATSNSNKEQPAEKQSLTLKSNQETENADSSIDVNKPLEDQESLCQDKLPVSSHDVQAEVPDKNGKAVASEQPFGDDVLTQPYCADVTISEQPLPGDTDRQEVQSVKTYPRRKQLKRTESGNSKSNTSLQEVAPVEDPHKGGVECEESAVTEVKSARTTRRRSKAKLASVNLAPNQKSEKAQKGGRPSTTSKLNDGQKTTTDDNTKEQNARSFQEESTDKFSSIKQSSKAEAQAKEQDLEAAEVQLQTGGADIPRQHQAVEDDDTAVALLEPLKGEHLSQERTEDMTDNGKTALIGEEEGHMESTQGYGEEPGDMLGTQPYDDHPVTPELSPNVGDSPEIKKSRPKRNQQSVCRKDKKQTKTKKTAKKVSDVPGDDSQKDNDSNKAGATDIKQNEDNLQSRTTRSGSSQQTETLTLQGRRSGRLRKLCNQALPVMTELITKKPVEVFEDAVVLLERLNTEKYGCPHKTPASTHSSTVTTEDEQMACTQAYGDGSDQVPNTQPYSEQPATEQLSLDNVKTRDVAKVRRSTRSRPSALRTSDRELKREKVVQRISNVDEVIQNKKGIKSEVRKATRTRSSQAEFITKNKTQTESEPSPPKEHIAGCKKRKQSEKKTQVKKDRSDVTVEQALPVPAIHIKQEICEDVVVLLERVDSSDSSFGEHSFHTSKTSHQKCLESKSKKYSRLSLKKGNKGQTNVETCIDDMDESHSAGHSRYTQLRGIKHEVGQNVGSAFMAKTRKRISGRKSNPDNFVANDMEADSVPPKIKKEKLCIKLNIEEYEQNNINIKTECVTAVGSIQSASEKPLSRRKRPARMCGRSREVHQDTSVQSAVSDIPEMSSSNLKNNAQLFIPHDCNTSKSDQFDTRLDSENDNDEFEPVKKKRLQRQKRGALKNTDVTEAVSQSSKSHLKSGMRANKRCSSTKNDASDKTAILGKDHIEDVGKKTPSAVIGESVCKQSSKRKCTPKRPKEVKNDCEAEQQTSRKKQKVAPKTPSTPRQKISHDSMAACSPSLRKHTLESKPKVMFTGVNEKRAKKIVTSLGGTLVSSIDECTHLVTDKVRRTVKFLCAVAKGLPVVSPLWLDSCKTAGLFLDSSHFLVEDRDSEKLYKFKLASSLKAASEHRMLDGYKIHVTPSVTPAVKEMKEIITCAGGKLLGTMPAVADANTVIVSCPKDQARCKAARSRGVAIVTPEFLLTGILQQVVDIDAYRL